jgi:hypothetical protein
MTRPAPLASLLLSFALLLPASAPAQQAPASETPVAPVLRSGSRIAPRSFEFRSLPPVAPGGEQIPVVDREKGREWEEYDQKIEAEGSPADLPVESFARFRSRPTPASASRGRVLAARAHAGNGFEGITQQGFIPSEPTVAAGRSASSRRATSA